MQRSTSNTLACYAVHTPESAPWHALITVAEALEQRCLPADLGRYLAALLLRYIGRPDFVRRPDAREQLGQLLFSRHVASGDLRAIAERCLIFVGLLADQAVRDGTPLSYYVNLGEAAYRRLGEAGDGLCARISERFIDLMDVMQSIRDFDNLPPCLDPLSTYQLWCDTGSRHAYRMLVARLGAVPVREHFTRCH